MKLRKIIAALTALTMLAVVFAGCSNNSSSGSSGGEIKGDMPFIGLSIPTLQEERWKRDMETIQSYCKELGVKLETQIADLDAQKQQSQCENLITKGIDILIVAPHDASAGAAIVDAANAAGVKVISYDRLIMDTDKLDLYLSFDNVEVGRIQGKYFTENVPDGSSIVWLEGAPTDNNAKLFKQGAAEYLQPKIDSGAYNLILQQACNDWKADIAMKHTENAISLAKQQGKTIAGVFATNDGTAGGAISALSAAGLLKDTIVTGMDAELAAAQRIVNDEQSMTVFKDTRALGKAAVDIAVKWHKGETVETQGTTNNNVKDVPSVFLSPVVVDKNNIDAVLIDSGYLAKEDVYKK